MSSMFKSGSVFRIVWRAWRHIPPIYYHSLALGLGIVASRLVQISFVQVAIVAACFVILIFFLKGRVIFSLGALVVFFMLGLLLGVNRITAFDHDIAVMGKAGRVTIEGIVHSVPEASRKGKKETVSFVLRAESFYRNGTVHETRGKVQVFFHNPKTVLEFGDRLRFRGFLEDPKLVTNPYAFNYARYLSQHGIYKVFRAIGPTAILKQEPHQANRILIEVSRLRVHLKNRIEHLLQAPSSALSTALLLGFRKGIPNDIRDDFVRSGTAHLLAISGLHISLVGGIFFGLCGFLRFPRAVKIGVTLAVIVIYVVLAGAKLPVLRAGVMGVVILLGLLFNYERNLKTTFFLAFFIFLALEPNFLFQASFQLSFIAVASLIFLLPKMHMHRNMHRNMHTHMHTPVARGIAQKAGTHVGSILLGSVAVMIGLFPVLVWYFNLFSLIGFLSNLIVVPIALASILSTLALLLLDVFWTTAAAWVSVFTDVLIRFELSLVKGLASVPLGHFYLPKPSWHFFLAYYGFLLLWIASAGRRAHLWLRTFCVSGMIVSITFFLATMRLTTFRLVLFDLPKSNVVFMSFSNRANFLVNSGRAFPGDEAYWKLRPFFLGAGIHRLDSVLLTEMSGAAAGGLRTLARHLKIKSLWVPEGAQVETGWKKYVAPTRAQRIFPRELHEKDEIEFGAKGEQRIEVLAQAQGEILAMRFVDGTRRILWLSSGKLSTFEQLKEVGDLKADILYLPELGIPLEGFVREVFSRIEPELVISNERDRPEQAVVGALQFLGAEKVFSLRDLGALEIVDSEGVFTVRTFKSKPPWTALRMA